MESKRILKRYPKRLKRVEIVPVEVFKELIQMVDREALEGARGVGNPRIRQGDGHGPRYALVSIGDNSRTRRNRARGAAIVAYCERVRGGVRTVHARYPTALDVRTGTRYVVLVPSSVRVGAGRGRAPHGVADRADIERFETIGRVWRTRGVSGPQSGRSARGAP